MTYKEIWFKGISNVLLSMIISYCAFISIDAVWDKYNRKTEEWKIYEKKIEIFEKDFNKLKEKYNIDIKLSTTYGIYDNKPFEENYTLATIGIVILSIGLICICIFYIVNETWYMLEKAERKKEESYKQLVKDLKDALGPGWERQLKISKFKKIVKEKEQKGEL